MLKFKENKEKTINFKSIYEEPIREKIKTSTIRRHFEGKVGDIFSAISRMDENKQPILPVKIAEIKITNIQRIRFGNINKEIARTEGYLHEDLCKDVILSIYPKLRKSSLLYYIEFEVLELTESNGK